MRIKGNIRGSADILSIGMDGIMIDDVYLVGSECVRVTTELLHAIVRDYAFFSLTRMEQIYSVHDLSRRRKATRRIIHAADQRHEIIEERGDWPQGVPYSWRQQVYDFVEKKFILNLTNE